VSSARVKRNRDSRLPVVKGCWRITFVWLRPLLPISVGICELVIRIRKDEWEQVNTCNCGRPGLMEFTSTYKSRSQGT